MDTNKMRAEIEKQFEQFFVEYEKKRDANGWMPLEAHVLVHMRSAWVASREAVMVTLPEIGKPAPEDDKRWHSVRNSTIGACRRAIEAAGLKVTP